MDCTQVRRLADAFVTEQVGVETAEAMVAHMERCPACREEIDGLRRLRSATRSAFEGARDLQPRREFVEELASHVRSAAAARSATRWSRRGWLAAAAGAVLGVAAGWGWREWSTASLFALLRAAAGDHRNCALTFALEEPPISLDEAVRRFGGAHGRLRNVEPSPSTLAGGPVSVVDRHSCVFDGRRFSHLVLRYKGELVSVLITDEAGRDIGTTVESQPVTDGLHVATIGDDNTAFVVSSLSEQDVLDVGRAIAPPLARALSGA
jgi:anti-sigma factor RsiW